MQIKQTLLSALKILSKDFLCFLGLHLIVKDIITEQEYITSDDELCIMQQKVIVRQCMNCRKVINKPKFYI